MDCSILSIHYFLVKYLFFSNLKKTFLKKKLGILNDIIFSFSRNIDFEKNKLIEKFNTQRNLNNFLTLKNSPTLNKYAFSYNNKKLTLSNNNKEILSIGSEDYKNYKLIIDKLIKLEDILLKPIFLLKNEKYPFFDTINSNIISNTILLININSVRDLENNINENIEFERFRGNLYVDGIKPWEERNWINKIIKINKILFRVQKHITRCSTTNLKPKSDNITINILKILKKHYNHIDMGVYLIPLDDGDKNIGNQVLLNE